MKLNRRAFLGYCGAAGVPAVGVGSAIAATTTEDTPGAARDIEVLVHLADTDYAETAIRNLEVYRGHHAELLMRSYAHIDFEGRLPKAFRRIHPAADRVDVLARSRVVVTSCLQAVAEAAAAGARPIYLLGPDTPRGGDAPARALGAEVVANSDMAYLRTLLRDQAAS